MKSTSGFSYRFPKLLTFSSQFYDYADFPADLTLATSPYYSSVSGNGNKQIKISAYSFRAYEGIYNAYIVIIVTILITLTDKFNIISGYRLMMVD